MKVLIDLFQKVAGVGSAHVKRHFSFVSFSLCASGVKEKSGQGVCTLKTAVATGLFNFHSHFFFVGRSRKEKVIKKKRRMYGALPQAPPAFEKAGQNYTGGKCEHTNKSKFFSQPIEKMRDV